MSVSAFGVDHGTISKGVGLKEAYAMGRAKNAADTTRGTAKTIYSDKGTRKSVKERAKAEGKTMDSVASGLGWKQRAAYNVGRNRDAYALGAGGTAVVGGTGAGVAAGRKSNDNEYNY